MTSENEEKLAADVSLDEVLDGILDRFENAHRIDRAHELFHNALHEKIMARGYSEEHMKLLELNMTGSISGWMEYAIQQRQGGKNAVSDFARYLRRAFVAHCKEHKLGPEVAVRMAVELATGIMDVAISFQRHLNVEDDF